MRHDSLRIDLGSNCCGRVNFSPSLSPREYESADVREGRCVENATRASDGQMAVIARETIASAGWVSMFNFIDQPEEKCEVSEVKITTNRFRDVLRNEVGDGGFVFVVMDRRD